MRRGEFITLVAQWGRKEGTHSGGLPTSKSNFGTITALFNAAGEFQCPSIGSIGGKHDARGKHFCTLP
jgi:hypothetical protein